VVGRVRGVQSDGGAQYFSAEPASASARRTITLTLPDLTIDLVTDRGVFSRERVDPGTKLLLSEVPPITPEHGRVLDLGCGYGPIAVTLAHRAPRAVVWAVDVNNRALALCAANALAAGVGQVRTSRPDEVPGDMRFATIWSNPPVRIGKEALHALLVAWVARLAPGGAAYLVVHKHLGADSLATWMAGRGWTVGRLASRQGYRVLEVRP